MKRILMIGDANHYFNRKLTEHLKTSFTDLQIDFFSIVGLKSDNLPYDNTFDGSASQKDVLWILRLRGVYSLYSSLIFRKGLLLLLKTKKYDVIHLQSANHWIAGIVNSALGKAKLVVTIWGSDFLRASSYRLKKMKPIFQKAEAITFATEKISNDFDAVYSTKGKHKIVKFGLEVFKYIDTVRLSISKSEKITVTIGYNRHPAQQHIAVVKSLSKLSGDMKDKIKLVFPFTYGPLDQKYLQELISQLDESGIGYEFLNEFMDEEQVAVQCIKSDVMIQVQKTDAFSGSMQEYLYADNVIITGSWLPYEELKSNGVYFITVDEIHEIANQLERVLKNYKHIKVKCFENKEFLRDVSSWEANITKWKQLYE